MEEVEAFAALASVEGLGAIKIRQLVEHFGSAAEAFKADPAKVMGVCGRDIRNGSWKEDLELAARLGVELIPFTSPQFPKQLLQIPDHPAMLYVKGKIESCDKRSIAVVGTRNASIYGMEMAEQISSELAARGFTIVSGLARGIDTASHRGALTKGRTLAVIGSGLADVYPPENRGLSQEISKRGALISEFPMRTPPDRQNFPQRNRIVSGMTLATLLIEAPIKSGAMITMERAWSQGRKLFALPGRADVEGFRGNHHLIKSGRAVLVESAADIAAHFEDLFPFVCMQPVDSQRFLLDEHEKNLLNSMPNEEIGVDHLSSLLNLPVHQVHTLLMGLILKKAVKEYPGKIYKKLAALNNRKGHN